MAQSKKKKIRKKSKKKKIRKKVGGVYHYNDLNPNFFKNLNINLLRDDNKIDDGEGDFEIIEDSKKSEINNEIIDEIIREINYERRNNPRGSINEKFVPDEYAIKNIANNDFGAQIMDLIVTICYEHNVLIDIWDVHSEIQSEKIEELAEKIKEKIMNDFEVG